MTLRSAFSNWLGFHAAAIKGSTSDSRRYSAERFFKWCEEHSVGFESVDRNHIAAFMCWCQKMGLKNSTIMMRVKELRSFFDWCIEEDLLLTNPVQLRRLPKLKIGIPHKVPFSFEQWQQAMTEAQRLNDGQDGQESIYEDFWPSAMTIAYHTGARISDVSLCRWANIDFETDIFVIYPRKKDSVKERLEIPMVPELREHLLGLWGMREEGSEFVLPGMATMYAGARAKMEKEFRKLLDAAGLPKHSFHSFRHSMVSRLINNGVDALIVSKITGQTTETIRGYAHISTDAKRTALMQSGQQTERTVTAL